MRHHPRRFTVLAALASTFALSTAAHAEWPHDPTAPLRITNIPKNNVTVEAAVADGSGGGFVFWEDNQATNANVFGQHVLFTGDRDPAWPGLGLPICTAAGNQTNIKAISDGAGGCWVCWNDGRGVVTKNYATRVLANGTIAPGFAADGVLLDSSRPNAQHAPQISDDGAGGMVAVWEYDFSPADHDIYAADIQAGGGILWASAFLSSASMETNPAVTREGGTLADVVCNLGPNSVIIARFNLLLGSTVNSPFTVSPNARSSPPKIAPDGWGGAMAAWVEIQGGNSAAAAGRYFGGAFNTFGVICPDALTFGLGDLIYAGDHQAMLAWTSGAGFASVGRQGLSRYGYSSVFDVGSAADPTLPVVQASDGAGGSVIAFNQSFGIPTAIETAANRGPQVGLWSNAFSNGLPAVQLVQDAVVGAIASDGDGGALIFSNDRGLVSANSGYVIRMDRFGAFDGTPHRIVVKDIPNDQGGHVRVSWNASYLDEPGGGGLSYALWRQVPAVGLTSMRAGVRSLRDPLDSWEPGTVRIQEAFGQVFAWELVTTQIANGFASYSLTVPTVSDSAAGGVANTVYTVEARMVTPAANWPSLPDSGHSVDNLPPATPSPFTGALVGGTTTQLDWGANSEPDLAGYLLYRGSSAGFVPGPANLIASPSGTGYLDHATGNYYKLAAIDLHGNRSAFALVTPGETLDAPGAQAPRAFAFALASANPSRAGAAFALALPTAAPVRIALYDLHGRLVRELMRGEQPAGTFVVRWDGRDLGGVLAPSGIYFARCATAGHQTVSRVLLDR